MNATEHQAPVPPPSQADAPARPRVLIAGCGRAQRRDDQLGLLVAERLLRKPLRAVRIIQSQAPGVDLLSELADVGLLIVVDAARGLPDGSWRRFELSPPAGRGDRLQLKGWNRHPGSCHSLSVADALIVGDELGILPPEVWVYALAGTDFGYGEELSPGAGRLVDDVAAAICAGIEAWRQRSGKAEFVVGARHA